MGRPELRWSSYAVDRMLRLVLGSTFGRITAMDADTTLRKYDRRYFDQKHKAKLRAAGVVLSRLLHTLNVRAVVDLGCGSGPWLAAAISLGVEDVLGIDGSEGATATLAIPREQFIECDLERVLPFVDRRFDLAICLETVEHLSDAAGDRCVDWLCDKSDVVLFSAAIPGQGGIGHVNEMWTSEWARRFALRDFRAFDVVRDEIWSNVSVPYWYRQNIVVFAKSFPAAEVTDLERLNRVHPELFLTRLKQLHRFEAHPLIRAALQLRRFFR
jgi:SAM-dependent methyltransferase